ncbi:MULTISPECIES: LLM class flavin-dependent oxidoreductase [Amycolatopsis]|uniref:LLM class flavin-dependent oxidoreductase n=1 Tax=Amycolatopsis TaxID=1813 RepID=UPI0002628CA3|nr:MULTISPECIES: LLM class flavin-dependent oxidoreductase [Amycolatopsis]MCF6421346.1 LLM class flavin-dependent oxidoreductase [Amycolatopsis tucumanensis]
MALPVLFGANVDPVWRQPDAPLRQARAAERLGLDLVTVQDHPYQSAFYDTWTLVTYLVASTERVTLVPTVSSLPLRPPAVLAKSAASLDLLSGGRIQLGLGAGAFWEAIEAMGGPRRDRKEAVDALAEAVTVVRAMWSGERSVRTTGRYYALSGVHPGPRPGRGLGLWLGAYGPRTLALTGARADGWLPSHAYLGLDRLGDAVRRIDDAAAGAGRDPAGIRKVYNVSGVIGGADRGAFHGPLSRWRDDVVTSITEHGMNGIVFWPGDDHERQLEIFAEELVPLVREDLATAQAE